MRSSDQICSPKLIYRSPLMQVMPILHEHLSMPLHKAGIRQTKQKALTELTSSLLNNSKLTLTSLGRHMQGQAFVKHKIKRVDRWLSNTALYDQSFEVYQAIFSPMLLKRNELHILIDWSGCCNWTECTLRASLLFDGRSICFYQEVHSTKVQQKPYIHKKFLKNLKKLIPEGCKVILITDRGFQVPWFKAVLAQGWDFIGRISNSHHFQLDEKKSWKPIKELYKSATNKPCYLGKGGIGKSKPLEVNFYSFKDKIKRRKFKKTRNKPFYAQSQKMYKDVHKTPLIIVTSLSLSAKTAIKAYQGRMQIEQNFRDDKNERWGFGMQYNRSSSKQRIAILLLIAAIASYILMLIGVTAEKMNLHKHFQANTSKRRVLSLPYLAKQVLIHLNENFSLKEIEHSYNFIAKGAS